MRKSRRARQLFVRALGPRATNGVLRAGPLTIPCRLGRSGRFAFKREGDGATPIGRWRTVCVLYRADRVRRPASGLPTRPLRWNDGWCDDPRDRNYNRPVSHPYPASAERLWRDDGLYDLIVVLDYNMARRSKGRGSAIFMHVANPAGRPTEGCIALDRSHLQRLLARLQRGTEIVVLR